MVCQLYLTFKQKEGVVVSDLVIALLSSYWCHLSVVVIAERSRLVSRLSLSWSPPEGDLSATGQALLPKTPTQRLQ